MHRISDDQGFAPLPLVDRRSSGDLVAVHIRSMIFNGELRQGDRMRQDEIAQRLGVSRIPVREAIIALDREGWLTITPHRGAFVHGLDEDALRDHYELLGLVYGLAARRATERASDDGARAPAATRSSSSPSADSPDTLHDANDEFLRTLLALGALAPPRIGDAQHVDRRARQLLRADQRQRAGPAARHQADRRRDQAAAIPTPPPRRACVSSAIRATS